MKRAMLVASILFLLAGTSAQGQTTLFSNFNTGAPPWDYSMGYAIGRTITGGNYAFAVPFSVASSQLLYTFELPIWLASSSGQAQGIIASINEAAPSQAGTLESLRYPGPFPATGTSGEALFFTSMRHPFLEVGKTYWIVVKTVDATLPNGTDTYIWNQNNTGGTGGCECFDRGETWNCGAPPWTAPAVRVSSFSNSVEAVLALLDEVIAEVELKVANSLVAKFSEVLKSLESGLDNAAMGGHWTRS